MNSQIIIDTGPLVAFLNKRDSYHSWADYQLGFVSNQLITCEAVITEACFLLRNIPKGQETVLELLKRDLIKIDFNLEEEVVAISKLLKKYSDVPISLADACLIKMSEQVKNSIVITLDSDFKIYRKNRVNVIPTIMP
ncbi:MAG: PIN domain-containing protein [Melioribacteraceae bacterium]|nr:PIN domain-containing protein [Melioribacteraceae bacterium]